MKACMVDDGSVLLVTQMKHNFVGQCTEFRGDARNILDSAGTVAFGDELEGLLDFFRVPIPHYGGVSGICGGHDCVSVGM